MANTWYNNLETMGNTSINPFFYGTYMAETKPNEPVSRTKKQAFQADAVGVVHQLTESHFQKPHTFRLEWQPGRGGRLDWFIKNYKLETKNGTVYEEGDGEGEEWIKAFSIEDKSLEELMGSQIPIEPSYLIMNVAVSSTWGFPYDTPDWCPKCYDCGDPRCACSFYPGFCQMIESKKTAMYIDSIRLYQSRDDSAHVGQPHTLGCDPPEFPTKGWIDGHKYHYSRTPPFSYKDKGPLRKVQRGGGSCATDRDCGADVETINWTAVYEGDVKISDVSTADVNAPDGDATTVENGRRLQGENVTTVASKTAKPRGRGQCTLGMAKGMFSTVTPGYVCTCREGFTGPHCHSEERFGNEPSAFELSKFESPFHRIPTVALPGFMLVTIIVMSSALLVFLVSKALHEKRVREYAAMKSLALSTAAAAASSNNVNPVILNHAGPDDKGVMAGSLGQRSI